MIFELYSTKIEITVEHHSPEQIQTMVDPPFNEDWEFSGIFVNEDGEKICDCPIELLRIYHDEIIEAVKEDKEW